MKNEIKLLKELPDGTFTEDVTGASLAGNTGNVVVRREDDVFTVAGVNGTGNLESPAPRNNPLLKIDFSETLPPAEGSEIDFAQLTLKPKKYLSDAVTPLFIGRPVGTTTAYNPVYNYSPQGFPIQISEDYLVYITQDGGNIIKRTGDKYDTVLPINNFLTLLPDFAYHFENEDETGLLENYTMSLVEHATGFSNYFLWTGNYLTSTSAIRYFQALIYLNTTTEELELKGIVYQDNTHAYNFPTHTTLGQNFAFVMKANENDIRVNIIDTGGIWKQVHLRPLISGSEILRSIVTQDLSVEVGYHSRMVRNYNFLTEDIGGGEFYFYFFNNVVIKNALNVLTPNCSRLHFISNDSFYEILTHNWNFNEIPSLKKDSISYAFRACLQIEPIRVADNTNTQFLNSFANLPSENFVILGLALIDLQDTDFPNDTGFPTVDFGFPYYATKTIGNWSTYSYWQPNPSNIRGIAYVIYDNESGELTLSYPKSVVDNFNNSNNTYDNFYLKLDKNRTFGSKIQNNKLLLRSEIKNSPIVGSGQNTLPPTYYYEDQPSSQRLIIEYSLFTVNENLSIEFQHSKNTHYIEDSFTEVVSYYFGGGFNNTPFFATDPTGIAYLLKNNTPNWENIYVPEGGAGLFLMLHSLNVHEPLTNYETTLPLKDAISGDIESINPLALPQLVEIGNTTYNFENLSHITTNRLLHIGVGQRVLISGTNVDGQRLRLIFFNNEIIVNPPWGGDYNYPLGVFVLEPLASLFGQFKLLVMYQNDAAAIATLEADFVNTELVTLLTLEDLQLRSGITASQTPTRFPRLNRYDLYANKAWFEESLELYQLPEDNAVYLIGNSKQTETVTVYDLLGKLGFFLGFPLVKIDGVWKAGHEATAFRPPLVNASDTIDYIRDEIFDAPPLENLPDFTTVGPTFPDGVVGEGDGLPADRMLPLIRNYDLQKINEDTYLQAGVYAIQITSGGSILRKNLWFHAEPFIKKMYAYGLPMLKQEIVNENFLEEHPYNVFYQTTSKQSQKYLFVVADIIEDVLLHADPNNFPETIIGKSVSRVSEVRFQFLSPQENCISVFYSALNNGTGLSLYGLINYAYNDRDLKYVKLNSSNQPFIEWGLIGMDSRASFPIIKKIKDNLFFSVVLKETNKMEFILFAISPLVSQPLILDTFYPPVNDETNTFIPTGSPFNSFSILGFTDTPYGNAKVNTTITHYEHNGLDYVSVTFGVRRNSDGFIQNSHYDFSIGNANVNFKEIQNFKIREDYQIGGESLGQFTPPTPLPLPPEERFIGINYNNNPFNNLTIIKEGIATVAGETFFPGRPVFFNPTNKEFLQIKTPNCIFIGFAINQRQIQLLNKNNVVSTDQL